MTSLNIGDIALILLAMAGAVAAGWYFFSKTRVEPVGVVRANDFTDEKLRQAVIRAVKGVDVASVPREEAEKLIEELSRHALAKEYATIWPRQSIEVTEHWPDARCIITGNIAVIDLWVGRSMIGDREGIRPIQVEVNRQATLKLEPRRPIREALDDMITGPVKKPEPVQLQTPNSPEKATVKPARATRISRIKGGN